MTRNYQLVVMGPEAGPQFPNIQPKLEDGFGKLGLKPGSDLGVVKSGNPNDINPRSVVAGVWFGSSADTTEPQILTYLISAGIPVLPLVEKLDNYSKSVPDVLHPINGREWTEVRVPGDLLRLFRLTREQRQAFISYRRVESGPVARQLFDALTGRGYSAFLDTASVEAAERFQDVLWSRMADVDLIVLLDTPNWLPNSRWVREELVRAQHLGLGVLRLTWPDANDDNKPTRGTEFCVGFDLKKQHFKAGNTGPDGELTAAAMDDVMAQVEEVRIDSLALRRRRITSELADRATRHKLRINYQPTGPITISSAAGTLAAVAIPVIGLPDAWAVHQEETRTLDATEKLADPVRLKELFDASDVRILFDSLGVDQRWANHLVWLNGHLKLQTVGFDRQRGQATDPLDQWLGNIAGRQP